MKIICTCLVVLLTLTSSCTSNDEMTGFNLVNMIQFKVVDSEGNNLIPTLYNEGTIKLFTMNTENEVKEVFEGNLDYPRHYKINEIGDDHILTIFPPFERENNNFTILIEWKAGEVDTIKTSYLHTNNATILQRVWYNDELIFSPQNGDGEYFYELVKN